MPLLFHMSLFNTPHYPTLQDTKHNLSLEDPALYVQCLLIFFSPTCGKTLAFLRLLSYVCVSGHVYVWGRMDRCGVDSTLVLDKFLCCVFVAFYWESSLPSHSFPFHNDRQTTQNNWSRPIYRHWRPLRKSSAAKNLSPITSNRSKRARPSPPL